MMLFSLKVMLNVLYSNPAWRPHAGPMSDENPQAYTDAADLRVKLKKIRERAV